MEIRNEKIIDLVIGQFDFHKVHKAMEATNWEWATGTDDNCAIPSIRNIIDTAKDLLGKVIEHYEETGETTSWATGGFTAYISENEIGLMFNLEETSIEI